MAELIRGLALLALVLACASPGAASTYDDVRNGSALRCGVVATPEDWDKTDLHGPLAPLSLEICKAVAVAALGDQAHVQARSYATEQAAEKGLSEAEVDLAVGLTPQPTAMWQWKIAFGPPVFFDGQGILLRHDYPMTSLAQLSGVRVCVEEGTDNEKVLLARTVARGIAINPMPFQEEGEMEDALAVRHCDAISAYVSMLGRIKATYPKQVGQDKILPEQLTLSPVAPAYRRDDPQWGMIVDWTVHALIQAEASGITRANVGAQGRSEDIIVKRLLGTDWATSRALGLDRHEWAADVISVVGNYGEIYDRTVGAGSVLKLPRGLNALWLDGGLMRPLPFQ